MNFTYVVPNLTNRTINRFAWLPVLIDAPIEWIWLVKYREEQILNGGKWVSVHTYLPSRD